MDTPKAVKTPQKVKKDLTDVPAFTDVPAVDVGFEGVELNGELPAWEDLVAEAGGGSGFGIEV